MTSSIHRFTRESIFRRLVVLATMGALGLAIGSATLSARPTEPAAADRQITFAVATLMERAHLTGQMLDFFVRLQDRSGFGVGYHDGVVCMLQEHPVFFPGIEERALGPLTNVEFTPRDEIQQKRAHGHKQPPLIGLQH